MTPVGKEKFQTVPLPTAEQHCLSLPLGVRLFCSRASSLLATSPLNLYPVAALCVQSDVVAPKAIPDIVFWCLTPVRFRRYSSSNLCLADSSLGGAHQSDVLEESN